MTSIQVYSDGACSGNPGSGGWGAVILYPNDYVELSGGEQATTNNRMELLGAIEALTHIQNRDRSLPITITTDSQYVKNGITLWIQNWKKNGWKTSTKSPVKNQDLWQRLDLLNHQLKPEWRWIKGHAGHQYNERCDILAVNARDQVI
ncbi:ribonuclease HI [Entomospira entomophila]|uniref:Ribonuclease H n=1 Tax=Entomospira entomophila TaxID=2719988 RepID=A0A968G7P8_9SPIO|nr:ribonuclease HI [Entomospira entomophilus]NIZ40137.1 ribonuclease HI [Entomospira entomophilus]WDI36143.1 ribonuclease HI [Entomospira entomophilus]